MKRFIAGAWHYFPDPPPPPKPEAVRGVVFEEGTVQVPVAWTAVVEQPE